MMILELEKKNLKLRELKIGGKLLFFRPDHLLSHTPKKKLSSIIDQLIVPSKQGQKLKATLHQTLLLNKPI
jgi:hypothetical protein